MGGSLVTGLCRRRVRPWQPQRKEGQEWGDHDKSHHQEPSPQLVQAGLAQWAAVGIPVPTLRTEGGSERPIGPRIVQLVQGRGLSTTSPWEKGLGAADAAVGDYG